MRRLNYMLCWHNESLLGAPAIVIVAIENRKEIHFQIYSKSAKNWSQTPQGPNRRDEMKPQLSFITTMMMVKKAIFSRETINEIHTIRNFKTNQT